MKKLRSKRHIMVLSVASIIIFGILPACNQIEIVESTNISQSVGDDLADDLNDTESNPSVPNIAEDKISESLIPIFFFYTSDSYAIDYQNNAFSVLDYAYSINDKYYASFYGSIHNTSSNEAIPRFVDCEYVYGSFLADDFYAINCGGPACPSDDHAIQFWHIPSKTLSAVFEVGEEDYCASYSNAIVSPDGNMVLISGFNSRARLYTLNPLEEVTIGSGIDVGGWLIPSPDKKFFVMEGLSYQLYKWTRTGIEFVTSFAPGRTYLSVSSDAKYMVYRDSQPQQKYMVIVDREKQSELKRVNESEIWNKDFLVDDAALSHDGQFLLVSGKKNDEFYVLIIEVNTMEILHVIDPALNNVPYNLRVVFLPESIRDTWEWTGY